MAKRKYRQSLIKRWVLHYILVILCIAVAFNWALFYRIRSADYNMATEYLSARASVVVNFLNTYHLNAMAYSDSFSQKVTQNLEGSNHFELQVLDVKGAVLHSSQIVQTNYLIPFEMSHKKNTWIGQNRLSGEKIIAVTLPILDQEEIKGYVRCLSSLKGVDAKVQKYVAPIRLATLVAVLLIFLLSLIFIRSVKNPIDNIVRHASEMASGQVKDEISVKKQDELGHLAETLNFMNSEILRHEKTRNLFISDISHEIKTPLTAISGWTELLLDGDNTDQDTYRQGLSAIQRETERLDKMVKKLLDYSRIEQSDFKLYRTSFDLIALGVEVVEIYQGRMQKLGIRCEFTHNKSGLMVHADRERIFQSLINLLDNAVKFRKNEGALIQFDMKEQKNDILISLYDNGLGILPEHQGHIFEKFYRGNGEIQGSGLGLSIVEKVIQTHGGQIWVESEAGVYTKFFIRLPK